MPQALQRWLLLLQANAPLVKEIMAALSCGVAPKTREQLAYTGAQVLQLAQLQDTSPLQAARTLGMQRLSAMREASERPNASAQDKQDYASALSFMRRTAPQGAGPVAQNSDSANTATPHASDLLNGEVLAKFNPGWRSEVNRRVNCRECVLAYDEWARTGNLREAPPSRTGDASMLPVTRKYSGRFERMPQLRLLISRMEQAGDGALGIVKLDIGDDFTHYINIVNVKGTVYLIDPQLDPGTRPPLPVTSAQAATDPSILREFLAPQIENWAQNANDKRMKIWQALINMGQTDIVDHSIERQIDMSLIRTRAGTGGHLAMGRSSKIAPENQVPGSPGGPRKAVGTFPGPGLPPPFLRVLTPTQGNANSPDDASLDGFLRYVRTSTLTAEALGYESTLRPAQDDPYAALDQQIDAFAKIKVKETNSLLVSDISSGAWSVVKVGSLNGRPVAMRWSPKIATESVELYRQRQLESIRGSKFLSDLGVGPRFHGLYTNARGETYEITDIVPGDHYDAVGAGRANPAITTRTFDDLEEILDRFESVGLLDLTEADAQYYLTPGGRLLAIDGGNTLNGLDPTVDAHPNRVDGSYTTERCAFLQYASEAVGTAYMEKLRTDKPAVWSTLVLTLHAQLNGPRPPRGLERHLDYVAANAATAMKLNES